MRLGLLSPGKLPILLSDMPAMKGKKQPMAPRVAAAAIAMVFGEMLFFMTNAKSNCRAEFGAIATSWNCLNAVAELNSDYPA